MREDLVPQKRPSGAQDENREEEEEFEEVLRPEAKYARSGRPEEEEETDDHARIDAYMRNGDEEIRGQLQDEIHRVQPRQLQA